MKRKAYWKNIRVRLFIFIMTIVLFNIKDSNLYCSCYFMWRFCSLKLFLRFYHIDFIIANKFTNFKIIIN